MLIDDYTFEIFTPPCDPTAVRFSAKAHLAADIAQVLPYLNAALEGTAFHPAAHALLWDKGGHKVAFKAREIGVSNVEDRDEALQELAELVELVNRTWEKRDKIIPSMAVRERPTPMKVYQLLPKSNCGVCGETSCWTFAAKLVSGQVQLAACPSLLEDVHCDNLAALQEMVV